MWIRCSCGDDLSFVKCLQSGERSSKVLWSDQNAEGCTGEEIEQKNQVKRPNIRVDRRVVGRTDHNVREALLAKGPDSSVGGVPVGYCPDEDHMEDEEVQVKVQVEEEERGETHGREQREEQGENKQSSRTHG